MKKEKKKIPNSYSKIFPFLLLIATMFMGIGYAAVNSITVDISGIVAANTQKGIFITDVTQSINSNDSKINLYYQKMLSTRVVLDPNDSDSYVTYDVTVYNSTDDNYVLTGATFDELFYIDDDDNYNTDIVFELTREGELISPHDSFTFQITFKYNDDTFIQNVLNSYISFVFDKVYSVTYVNSENSSYPTTVIENNTLVVDMSDTLYDLVVVKIDGVEVNNYTFENKVLTIPNVTGNVSIEGKTSEKIKIFNKEYTVVPYTATLTTSSNNTSDTGGLYKSTNINSGDPTYYFRGYVQNNYVSFAGYMWRIVRVNEDGTIRLIMQDGINNNTYYKFYPTANSYGMQYTYYTNTNISGGIKYLLDNWYNQNLSDYSDYILTGDYYCEEAKVKSSDSYTSGSATMTVYSSYTPNFKCATDGNGKGLVNSSICLLTYDEVVHAGGYFNTDNNLYYLYNNTNFWTMSSAGTLHSGANVPFVWYDKGGAISYTMSTVETSNVSNIVRPVINIRSDIGVSGSGTGSDPFVVHTLKETILANNSLITSTPTLTAASVNTTDVSGLYVSTDTNDGSPTYYYRGNVTNNYVDFAGFTWRIVRINEDGTVRLVMTEGIDNRGYNFSAEATGLEAMYFTNTNIENSAKYILDNWYNKNLSNYSDVIATGNYYCEQAKVKLAPGLSSGDTEMALSSDYIPNFKCVTDGNGYGLVNSNIGLLTYDEILHAGGYAGQANGEYFLYSSNNYWTMSAAGVNGAGGAYEWFVDASGNMNYVIVNDGFLLRPVINLKANTVVTGSGTSDDHYVVHP